jgi:hypothetical protein
MTMWKSEGRRGNQTVIRAMRAVRDGGPWFLDVRLLGWTVLEVFGA